MHVAKTWDWASRTKELLLASTMAAVLVTPFYTVASANSGTSAETAAAEETGNGQSVSEASETEQDKGSADETGATEGETTGGESGASATGEADAGSAAGAGGGQFLESAQGDVLSGEQLVGMEVVASNGDSLGTVTDILLQQDGTLNGVVISSGGFLGIGEKQVGVRWDSASMSVAENKLQTGLSQQDIQDAPAYEAAPAGGEAGTGEGRSKEESGAAE
ncbi:PRC-barrel domain-containing protein [Limimonas halophila]|uniref:PRC-barrel domain-containing protein n=1 Tax=Limimonas halophila TaxID=1082479 RepID=A0A1G7LIA9_9PROT|nr:PRC-barrel domain-containing protein [Limimonas halophila]SDF49084.1 PRC-barrel domain-containing protein [Limimonas halophila]